MRQPITTLLAVSILLAAALAAAQDLVPGSVPDGPHPWRTWEAERRIAALERQSAATATDKAIYDPDPNQLLYDVHHYDLSLDVDLAGETVTGTLQLQAHVVDETIDTLVLDLNRVITTLAARVGGQPTTFDHPLDHLTIDLDRAYQPGESLTIAVDYTGDPSQAGSAFGWAYAQSRKLVWTLSEPYGARTWWPCKDFNTDKADSLDVRVTIDDPWVVASNGLLVTQEQAADRTTYHWRSRYPIATYLVSITAYPYAVFTDTYTGLEGEAMPVENYVVPEYEQEARDGYGQVPDMIAAFREGYGEYPFLAEKYGHAHFTWGGGMEHQTCSSMIYWFHGEGLIAHELAHQWWGDLVTCADFGHIWLNEGFATWSEAYWREQTRGRRRLPDEMADNKYLGGGTIYVEDPDNFGSIFDIDLSYNKASWVVHMLRGILGDQDFFAGLALYRERFAFGSATTEDLQAVLEDVSGRDLGAFFQRWIYGAGYPSYRFAYLLEPQADSTLIHVRIEQLQDEGLFEMPIRLRLFHALGSEDVVVENTRREQHYLLTGPADVTQVAVRSGRVDPADRGARHHHGDARRRAGVAGRGGAESVQSAHHGRMDVPHAGRVHLAVVDARGRLVRTLLDDELAAGSHRVAWDGRDQTGRGVAAGVYFAVLRQGDLRETARMALVR